MSFTCVGRDREWDCCGKIHADRHASLDCISSSGHQAAYSQRIPVEGVRSTLEKRYENWVVPSQNPVKGVTSERMLVSIFHSTWDFGGVLDTCFMWRIILNAGGEAGDAKAWLRSADASSPPVGDRSKTLAYARRTFVRELLGGLEDELFAKAAFAAQEEWVAWSEQKLLEENKEIEARPNADPKGEPEAKPDARMAKLHAALEEAMGTSSIDPEEVAAIAKGAATEAIAGAIEDGSLVYSIQVVSPEGAKWTPPEGALHNAFESVMQFVSIGEPVIVKGPAGTGKSFLAEQVAQSLGFSFASMSLSGGTAEHHFLGSRLPDATGAFVHRGTPFLEAFEEGGVMLLDEVDACDENVLLAINNGIANGSLPVPGRDGAPFARKHKDFRLIAAANTWGTGASAMYVGRNQLDAAFLDRFAQVSVDYDRKLEMAMCKDHPSLSARWHEIRDAVAKAQLRRVVSMRGLIRSLRMMDAHDWTVKQCVEQLVVSWTADERKTVGV